MSSMPTSPAGSSSRKPPAFAGRASPPVCHARVGSHSASSSSLVGCSVVRWMTAIVRVSLSCVVPDIRNVTDLGGATVRARPAGPGLEVEWCPRPGGKPAVR